MDELVGQRIGSYRVVRVLGAGGMGVVYEVVHEQIGHRAAIKVIKAHRAEAPDAVQRFLNEARAANRVQDPGIVRVHEYGQLADGRAYLVMEYLEGETLAARLDRERGAERVTRTPSLLGLLRQVASALAEAHAGGIVHRDLKPSNLMLCRDPEMPAGERAKILDFGIAKDLLPRDGDGPGPRTDSDVIMGTPTYMAPEQCRGAGQVDGKADVYSLGCVLYEVLSGMPPFQAEGSGEIIGMHLHTPPSPLRDRASHVGPRLSALVHAMLDKQRDERPSMREVAAALQAEDEGARSEPPPGSPSAPGDADPVPSTLDRATGEGVGRAPAARVRRSLIAAAGIVASVGLVGAFVAPRGAPPQREARAMRVDDRAIAGAHPLDASAAALPVAAPSPEPPSPSGMAPASAAVSPPRRTRKARPALTKPKEKSGDPDGDYVPEAMVEDPSVGAPHPHAGAGRGGEGLLP